MSDHHFQYPKVVPVVRAAEAPAPRPAPAAGELLAAGR
jgi:hypothetical protein